MTSKRNWKRKALKLLLNNQGTYTLRTDYYETFAMLFDSVRQRFLFCYSFEPFPENGPEGNPFPKLSTILQKYWLTSHFSCSRMDSALLW